MTGTTWSRSARARGTAATACSYVKLDRILKVSPGKVRREGATLDKARFDHVIEALQVYAKRNH